MHNFKPGDLALIISGKVIPANLGRVVRLVESLGNHSLYSWGGVTYSNPKCSQVWVIEACGEALDTVFGGQAVKGPILEYKLAPLRGDFKPDEDDLAEYADTSFYDLRTGRQRLVGGRE